MGALMTFWEVINFDRVVKSPLMAFYSTEERIDLFTSYTHAGGCLFHERSRGIKSAPVWYK